MTTHAKELEQQRRWRLKPQFAGMRTFDQLLTNEFRAPAEHEARSAEALRFLIPFAVKTVPYYAELFAKRGLRADDIRCAEDLAKLPILTKQEVIASQDTLRARELPKDDEIHGPVSSSGTTGRPVTVLHSKQSVMMFTFLRQRTSRWFGLDPMGSRVDVRPGRDLQRNADGSAARDNAVTRSTEWRFVGMFFETGPEYAFNLSNPMETQVTWLRELRPDYAMSYPGVFEEWLFANEGRTPSESLKGLIGIGSQLTPSLHASLERAFRVPVHMAYGLNEIGQVAVRCEAGRYHVHAEHCLVQIVRPDGAACVPGETGHVLVTGLRNAAMPLIRYDTGDLAEATEGACECGRTLPSFGEIAGRFRRYAGLPVGTREIMRAIRVAMESFEPAQLAFMRRYQVHQDRQRRVTLRLRTAAPVPDTFRDAIARAWKPVAHYSPEPLTIVEVEEIAASPSGKLLDFTSDFYDDSYAQATPAQATELGDG